MFKRLFISAVFLIAFSGCAFMMVESALSLMEGQLASLREEADPDLARQAIPAQLKILEGLLKSDENNVRVMDRLAEGFCGYAFGFVEEEDPVRASALYLRGKRYAERSLEERTAGRWSGNKLEGLAHSLALIEIPDLSSLFWLGQCWGGWLRLNLSDLSALADLSKVEAVMRKAAALDPDFYHAGPRVFLGGFYGGRSRMLGGDPEKGRKNFEESLRITQRRFLPNQYLYAKTYAVQTGDRKLFENLLNEILDAPDDLLPDQRLANALAKRKARNLLDSMDDLF